MNERNVISLSKMLIDVGIVKETDSEGRIDLRAQGWALDHAKALAARGVLVPSVLTAEQCEDLPLSMFPTTDAHRAALPDLVEGLERIAKGETL